MGSLTETRCSGLSVVIGPCACPPRFPQTLRDPQWATWTHRHPTLPAGPSPITSSVLLPCSRSVPCHSPRFSLFHFPNSVSLSSPNLLLILLPCISLCGPSSASLLLASLSPGLLTVLSLHHSPPTSLSYLFPAILSLCLQPLHPSGVVPHFQKLPHLTLTPPHHGHHFPCHLHANMLSAWVVLRDIA